MSFDAGTRCWYPSEAHGWVAAEVTQSSVSADGSHHLELALSDGEVVQIDTKESLAQLEQLSNITAKDAGSDGKPVRLPVLRNPPILESIDDLTALSYLNEPAVLHAIKERYASHNIYTYSGIVLIAANPFAKVDELYSQEMISKYASAGANKHELEPHLFAIADEAYSKMINESKNQTIVVSGESGAGKTVSAKYIMRYFASIEPQVSHNASSGEQVRMTEIEEKILATNPILEAFGNAKTTRNDNSSRFGKYLEILFNARSQIVGARIRTYLLERSRLVFQPQAERNYHIFYQLLGGLPEETREKLHLPQDAASFNYMNQGGSDTTIKDVDDGAEFQKTKDALSMIGFDADTQDGIFQILAALLHIGNIEITKTRNDASLSSDEANLQTACELLGVDSFGFAKWMVKKQITTRSEKIVSNLNHTQALVARDSVAQFLYSALFEMIVDKINSTLNSNTASEDIKSFIGVLDIYGFEHFERNSFEQFCINYANEKLQQEFNQHVFKLEQEEYVRENIEWSFIEFNDNQPCIDLIENKLGILSLLDEESRLPAGSDETWAEKLYQSFDKPPTNAVFAKPRFGQTKFVVSHYAHAVTYDVEGFIEKNRDTVSDGQYEVLKATTNPTLKHILDSLIEKQEKLKEQKEQEVKANGPMRRNIQRKPTLGSMFKESLVQLMTTIESTNVHYIRCIKPNSEKTSWGFDNLLVLSQLRACGILETIRISCAGFPSRWTFAEFIERFYFLSEESEWRPIMENASTEDPALITFTTNILQKLIEDEQKYQIGKTKIFFKAGMLAYLEKIRTAKLAKICVVIQKKIRGLHYRREYLRITQSIKRSQAFSRGRLVRDRVQFELETRAAITIQSIIRGHTQLSYYRSAIRSSILLQSVVRRKLAVLEVERRRKDVACTKIQTILRSYMSKTYYAQLRLSSVTIQCHIRKALAQKQFAIMKEEFLATDPEKQRIQNNLISYMEKLLLLLEHDNTILSKLNEYERNGIQSVLESVPNYHQNQNELILKKKKLDINVDQIKKLLDDYNLRKDSSKADIKAIEQLQLSDSASTNLNTQLSKLSGGIDTIKAILNKTSNLNSDNKKEMFGLGILSSVHSSPKIGFDEMHELSTILCDVGTINQEFGIILRGLSDILRDDKSLVESTVLANITNTVLESFFKIGKYSDADTFTKENVSAIFEIFSTFRRDDLVYLGMFWVSNIYHIYVNIVSIRQGESGNREAALSKIEAEYKTLLLHCYHTWLKRVTQTISHQHMISRNILGPPSANVSLSSEEGSNEGLVRVLSYFDELYKIVSGCDFSSSVIRGIVSNILASVDVHCCNDILNKFPELSWKVGVNIDKSTTLFCDWAGNLELGAVDRNECLPLLKQMSKLLQLRVSNNYDLQFVMEVCYSLNVTQINAVLKKYKPSKYESPISSDVLNYLANNIKRSSGRNIGPLAFPDDVKTLADPFAFTKKEPVATIETTSVPHSETVAKLVDTAPMVFRIITMAQ
ncbi:myosin 4 [Maudiozyma humilis]|uniref:Myosin 4 n=1 Tax=Maudiozyma humilis TaxID=51915 RepID=A0AAV5RWM9_MAUHU|nr:myosin 4 [Kazachstania humilis]